MTNEEMRELTGNVDSDSDLVSFFYTLMRDHLPAGVIESIIEEHAKSDYYLFTNGYLANYAKMLAERLVKCKP